MSDGATTSVSLSHNYERNAPINVCREPFPGSAWSVPGTRLKPTSTNWNDLPGDFITLGREP